MRDTMTFTGTPADLKKLIREAIREEKQSANAEKLYTIADAGRILGKAYTTICRMIKDNRIESTADGRFISQKAIENYLTTK